jgi:thiamine biosynthesis protein ThiI
MAQRRLLVRVAAVLAAREEAGALVTGDSLGQVASQTLPNLAAVEDASPLPLLRPLVALDKAEIIAEADELGTLEISHLPDEDCCKLFASRLAETRADPRALRRLERLTDAEEAAERLVSAARLVRPGDDEPEPKAPNGPPGARIPAGV